MKRAVVLLSGGIDSTVTLAVAKREGFEVYAVSFNYGQRHNIELILAGQSSAYFTVQKHLTIKFDLREIGGSALTSDIEVPKDRFQNTEQIPITYVPARNTIFLSFALAFAESINAGDIFLGANVVDYGGYPDCRPEFIKAFEDMANLATKASVEGRARFRVHAPLINLTKSEIIKKGAGLGVDFSLTWSCYDPQKGRNALSVTRSRSKKKTRQSSRVPHHGYVPCMRCDSCLLRAKGFREAGIKDPLTLTVKH